MTPERPGRDPEEAKPQSEFAERRAQQIKNLAKAYPTTPPDMDDDYEAGEGDEPSSERVSATETVEATVDNLGSALQGRLINNCNSSTEAANFILEATFEVSNGTGMELSAALESLLPHINAAGAVAGSKEPFKISIIQQGYAKAAGRIR